MPTKFIPKPISFHDQKLFSPFVYNEKIYVVVSKETLQFTMRCVLSTGRLGGKKTIHMTEYVDRHFVTTDKRFFVRISEYTGTNPADHTI